MKARSVPAARSASSGTKQRARRPLHTGSQRPAGAASAPTRRDVARGLTVGLLGWMVAARAFTQPQDAAAAIADAKFASLLSVGDRTWATVSKPREGGFDTLCNGGLVAGKEGVLAFDCYASVAGAEWMVERSRSLTGLLPTDIVLSHHHGDHTRGLAGFAVGTHRPQVWTTRAIRDRVAAGATGPAAEMLAAAKLVEGKTTVDLGGRGIVLTPLQGHTASDLIAQIDDEALFCGDLLWNELFPNYVDALPDLLGPSVDMVLAAEVETWVPGHGPLPDRAALDRYRTLITEVEAAGRASFAAGKSPEDAAGELALTPPIDTWFRFSPDYYAVALRAWHRRLKG